jgi:hypothetical protein
MMNPFILQENKEQFGLVGSMNIGNLKNRIKL